VPRWPLPSFSLQLDAVGVQRSSRAIGGYVRPERGGTLKMRVAAPEGWAAYVEDRRVASAREGGLVVFDLPTERGTAARWEVAAPGARRTCASRRRFVIRLRGPRGERLRSARVTIAGKRVRVLRGMRARIDLRGRRRGRVTVRIRGVTRSGRRVTATRRYRTCTRR